VTCCCPGHTFFPRPLLGVHQFWPPAHKSSIQADSKVFNRAPLLQEVWQGRGPGRAEAHITPGHCIQPLSS
jgi:hypothetical protein